jgi:hypothetical protein
MIFDGAWGSRMKLIAVDDQRRLSSNHSWKSGKQTRYGGAGASGGRPNRVTRVLGVLCLLPSRSTRRFDCWGAHVPLPFNQRGFKTDRRRYLLKKLLVACQVPKPSYNRPMKVPVSGAARPDPNSDATIAGGTRRLIMTFFKTSRNAGS